MFKVLLALLVAGGVAGCGAGQQGASSPTNPTQDSVPPPPEVSEPALPAGHVWRSRVMAVLSPGPGRFLQKLDVVPKLVDERFYGFRVVALRDRQFWSGVDLRVGDVIRTVNGVSIGRYDDAFRVWQSMATAPELVVDYERGGRPMTLRYVIHDPDDEEPTASGEVTPTTASKPAQAPSAASQPSGADHADATAKNPKAGKKGIFPKK